MSTINIQKIIDESKFNGYHGLILFWCFLILVLDGYDLAVVGAALPLIMKEMGVTATTAGFMASSALFGMMLGAMFFGTLADRLGRPRMLVFCIGLFSVFTAAAGLTHDPLTFSLTRFVAGLGIGGVLPIAAAQMGEYAPVSIRTRLVAIVFAGYAVGGILVALTGKQLIQDFGWQSVFYVAGLPVLLIPLILKTMPESVPYLIRRDRGADLRKLVGKIVPGYTLPSGAQFVASANLGANRAPVLELFHDRRGFSTVMIWIAFFFGLFMVYALSSWLTKLLALSGYSLGSALNFILVFNIGAIVGALGGAWLGDRFNIKYVLVSLYAVGAVSLTLMGFVKSSELLFVMVFIVGATTLGTQLVAYAYAAAFYPAAIRSTGVGFASGIGRAGGILAPIMIGALVALNLPLEQNFMAIGLAGLLGMISVVLINHRLCDSVNNAAAA
ncbi:MFS transporter [Rugamonas apoptosis]|uniref:MFS transporter n=1 Tax=Rugamonas apoptosis TaxID=2758570 RepID=A0A7W2FDW7_9BURK|nr:MFS transporter [Rugamonas apoptosis]MBA5689936.1 MFS transporter [Rugamonas apoptosis]